jgi:hypothetical protein
MVSHKLLIIDELGFVPLSKSEPPWSDPASNSSTKMGEG